MPDFIVSDPWVILDGYDLSGASSEAAVTVTPDIKEYVKAPDPGSAPTPPGTLAPLPFKSRLVGAQDFSFMQAGVLNDEGIIEALLHPQNLSNVTLLTGQQGRHIGDLAWLAQIATAGYTPSGKVGDLATFKVDAKGNSLGLAGFLLGYGTVSASANTTPFQCGPVGTGKGLFMGLAVTGRTGTATFTGTHKTAATSGGSYTSRHAFTTISAAPGAPPIFRVAGPITDTWHRLDFVIGGAGTISFVYVAGIV